MVEIVTYRDLQLAVSQLIAQYSENARPLEEYLRALWRIAERHRAQPALTPDEFFRLLADSFTAEAQALDLNDEFWQIAVEHLHAIDTAAHPGFLGWDHRIARQVVDLREMAESGQLEDDQRQPGLLSPRGSIWYTFDTCTFLKYAASDWLTSDDDELVPEFSWERFRTFLGSGQWA